MGAIVLNPEADVAAGAGTAVGDAAGAVEAGKLPGVPGVLNEVRARLMKAFGSKAAKVAIVGGLGLSAANPGLKYSLKQLNTTAKGKSSNSNRGANNSDDTSSKYNKNTDAQVVSQGIHNLQTTLSNGTKYTSTQRAQLTKALSYLKTAKMDLQKKQQYQSMASAAETVNLPQSVSQQTAKLAAISSANTGAVLQRQAVESVAPLATAPSANTAKVVSNTVEVYHTDSEKRDALLHAGSNLQAYNGTLNNAYAAGSKYYRGVPNIVPENVGYKAYHTDKDAALRQLTKYTEKYNAENHKNPVTDPIVPNIQIPGTPLNTDPFVLLDSKPSDFILNEVPGTTVKY